MTTDFSLANAQYNDFLYEPIGEDARGITVSMFSGLARLELDPWRESARFAALPLEAARTAIAERIAELNVATWDAAANLVAAARLVKLLPRPGRAAKAAPRAPTTAARAKGLLADVPVPSDAFLRTLIQTVLPIAFGVIFLLTVGAMIAEFMKSPAPGASSPFGNVPGLNSRQKD